MAIHCSLLSLSFSRLPLSPSPSPSPSPPQAMTISMATTKPRHGNGVPASITTLHLSSPNYLQNNIRIIDKGFGRVGVQCKAAPELSAITGTERGESEKEKQRNIIVIDNYDSFTYNICQYMGELGLNFEVYRNDELAVEDINRMNSSGILISPGPGAPRDSGISLQTVLELGPTIPIFGVCMGLQCIGEAFGGKIVRAPTGVMHGKSSLVYYDEEKGKSLFDGMPNPFKAGRYHSLVIERESFPADVLEITAWTEDGLIMAARHKKYHHILGVQFHPESILTDDGKAIILNFAKFVEEFESNRV